MRAMILDGRRVLGFHSVLVLIALLCFLAPQPLGAGGGGADALLAAPAFTPAESLTAGRAWHTATLLNDGRVLVAGGYDGSACLASAELYEPLTGRWSATGAMTAGRAYHTATLLPNGRVLVAGGQLSSGSATASCELYDPASGLWSPAGGLTTARQDHTAALLNDGTVLAAGGYTGSDVTASAEVYTPSTNLWASAGTMATARRLHTATLLSYGGILVAGGQTAGGGFTATCEIYTPGARGWSAAGALNVARAEHGAVRLPSGNVLAAGGRNGTGALADTEVYDPTGGGPQGEWHLVSDLGAARGAFTLTLLPDGRAVGCGGYTGTTSLSTAEVFDPAGPGGGAWASAGTMATGARAFHTATLLPDGSALIAGGRRAGVPPVDFEYARACEQLDACSLTSSEMDTGGARAAATLTPLPDGTVLAAGGLDGSGTFLNTAQVYNPLTGVFSPTGSLTTARSGHKAVLLPTGNVLAMGGVNSGGPVTACELYRPDTHVWSPADPLPSGRKDFTATLLPSGDVLAAGGNDGASLPDAYLYHHIPGIWEELPPMSQARDKHAAALLRDGRVLLTGGRDDSSGSTLKSCTIFDPSTKTWSGAAQMVSVRRDHKLVGLPDGHVLAIGGDDGTGPLATCENYDPAAGTWSGSAALTSARSEPVAAVTNEGKVLAGGGEGGGRAPLTSIEAYDPARDAWDPAGDMSAARTGHAGALLSTGEVLFWGGTTAGGSFPATADLWTPGLGYAAARRPALAAAGNVVQPAFLSLTGTKFRGDSDGSGGGGQASSTGHPVVQLQRIDDGRIFRLMADPYAAWQATSFQSETVCGLPFGHYYATVFVNGVPGDSKVILATGPTATVSGGGEYCQTGSAQVQAALAGASPWDVTWSDGVTQYGVTASPASRTVSPSATTTYRVASVTGDGCAGASYGEAVVEVGQPIGDVEITSNAPLCQGHAFALELYASCDTEDADYHWTGPAGFDSTVQNPMRLSPIVPYAGTYDCTISHGGCTANGSVEVAIHVVGPGTPGNDLHVVRSGGDLVLTWGAVAGADGYLVYYTDDCVVHPWPDPYTGTTPPSGWTAWSATPTASTSLTLTGGANTPGLRYLHVVPTNACGTNFSQPR